MSNKSFNSIKEKSGSAYDSIKKILQNPMTSQVATSFAFYAKSESLKSEFQGGINGQQDAYRHILWAAQTRRRMAEIYPDASPEELDMATKEALSAHEDSGSIRGQSLDSESMDIHNNDIGISVGREAYEKKLDIVQTQDKIGRIVTESDGKGENGGPFWQDESDPDRVPPKNNSKDANDLDGFKKDFEKPLTVGEELRRVYRKTMGLPEENQMPQEMKEYPEPRSGMPEPDDAEIDPQTGKRFGDMGVGEYLTALHRWLKNQKANDNAPHANQNLKEANSGGEVSVKAHSREGGKEQVRGYTRRKPQG